VLELLLAVDLNLSIERSAEGELGIHNCTIFIQRVRLCIYGEYYLHPFGQQNSTRVEFMYMQKI
jgi:hypothetical protein